MKAFSHDYGARDDARMVRIRIHHGMTRIGVYWCIIEMLYEHDGAMPMAAISDIAFECGVDEKIVRGIIADFGLFDNDGTNFWSPSAIRRIEHRQRVSQARACAGRMGGAPTGNRNRTGKTERKQAKRFRAPTTEEVAAEISRRGYSVDADAFVAFYTSKNWMIGKNKMKSWPAALTTWEKRNARKPATKPTNNVNDIWQ